MLAIALLALTGTLMMFLGFSANRNILLSATAISIAGAIGALFFELHNQALFAPIYTNIQAEGMLDISLYPALFSAVMLTSALLVLPFATRYVSEPNAQLAEFCALMLFTLTGGLMMAFYTNMIMLFVGLEILSISVYVLSGTNKREPKSNEAALKYFLMGAFATGILLFGVAMLYGSTGSFELSKIASATGTASTFLPNELRQLGIIMVLVGILFKASAAPFHFWTADVYEGAPTVFTAFMATVVKTAAIAALVRVIGLAFIDLPDHATIELILTICAVLTLVIGNLLALVQNNFKRMMAYSSISHAGYLLLALLSGDIFNMGGIAFYTLAYGLATVTCFGVLLLVSDSRSGDGFEPFRGLGKAQPLLALSLTVALSSLGGIPLTAGFIGKFYMFSAALQVPYLNWIVLVAILGSAISMYYYYRVVSFMYISDRVVSDTVTLTLGQRTVFYLATGLTIVLGIAPGILQLFVG
jgi:NADH-quinone oxidoreductase subunit N